MGCAGISGPVPFCILWVSVLDWPGLPSHTMQTLIPSDSPSQPVALKPLHHRPAHVGLPFHLARLYCYPL